MCGISGKLFFDPNRPVRAQDLKRMTDSLVHRGPDDEGLYLNSNIGLGFRRLSIIDLHTGHQPLCNEDESIWIVFNGEIYNYPELHSQLKSKGHVFRTQTDTETIVHLYEEYGETCVQYLRGMFAFAVWDNNKKVLFCARDRFGKKPFYYHLTDDGLIFGSEIRAILTNKDVSPQIDPLAIDSFFAFKYITDNRCIYRAIKKLPAAHTLKVCLTDNRPKIGIGCYWDIKMAPDESKTEAEWCEELESTLSESVRLRMVSDVPLGAFLSGGIDSSVIVALMAKHSSQPIKTFSIGFKESEFNELPYARVLSEKYQTEHHEQIIEPDSIEILPMLVDAFDEPFADSSSIPTYYVSKFARENVTVVLSGDGGDELFAGYNTYPKFYNISLYNRLPHCVNQLLWGQIHRLLPTKYRGKGLSYFLSQYRDLAYAHQAVWTQPERTQLFRQELSGQFGKHTAETYKEEILRTSTSSDYLSRMLELDMRTYMVDDILTKVDRSSMMNSLEVRVPILDHKFAELSYRIPSHLKLKNGSKKYIFRKAMSKYLPPVILEQRKRGFGVPLKMWFKDSLRDYVHDHLLNNNSPLREFLQLDYVAKAVQDSETSHRDLNQKIWTLLVFDAWLRGNHSSA